MADSAGRILVVGSSGAVGGQVCAEVLRQCGADVVFDGVGGANFWHSYRSLRAGGRLVAYGVQAAVHGSRASIATLRCKHNVAGAAQSDA